MLVLIDLSDCNTYYQFKSQFYRAAVSARNSSAFLLVCPADRLDWADTIAARVSRIQIYAAAKEAIDDGEVYTNLSLVSLHDAVCSSAPAQEETSLYYDGNFLDGAFLANVEGGGYCVSVDGSCLPVRQAPSDALSITVIIPCYNYGHLIEEALESVFKQTVAPVKLFVVNDGSDDDSDIIIREYLSRISPRFDVEYISHQKNKGVVGNFNDFIARVETEYYIIVGADNRLRRDAIEELSISILRSPAASIYVPSMLLFGQRSALVASDVGASEVARSRVENYRYFAWKFNTGPDARTSKGHGSALFNTKVVRSLGGYIDSAEPEDKDLISRIVISGGTIEGVEGCLVEYRQHSWAQANTVQSLKREISRLKIQVRRGQKVDENGSAKQIDEAQSPSVAEEVSRETSAAPNRTPSVIIPPVAGKEIEDVVDGEGLQHSDSSSELPPERVGGAFLERIYSFYENRLNEQQSKLELLQADYLSECRNKERVIAELSALQNKFDSVVVDRSEADAVISQLSDELEQAGRQLTERDLAQSELTEELDRLQVKLDRSIASSNKSGAVIDRLKQELEHADKLVSERDEALSAVAILEEKLSVQGFKLSSMRGKLGAAARKAKAERLKLDRTIEASDRKDDYIKSLVIHSDDLERERLALTDKLQAKVSEATQRAAEAEDYLRELEAAKAALDGEHSNNLLVKQELDQLKVLMHQQREQLLGDLLYREDLLKALERESEAALTQLRGDVSYRDKITSDLQSQVEAMSIQAGLQLKIDSDKNRELDAIRDELDALRGSFSWRIMGIYRATKKSIRNPKNLLIYLRAAARLAFELSPVSPRLKDRIYRAYKKSRLPIGGFERCESEILSIDASYNTYLIDNRISATDLVQIQFGIEAMESHPKVSIIMPLYKSDLQYLALAISSVREQIYENIELLLLDDGNNDKELDSFVMDIAEQDSRIRYLSLEQNAGISEASNYGITNARGSYITFMDHDDVIYPDTIYHIVRKHLQGFDFVYTDDDKIGEDGLRYAPQFKPDYSERLLLSHMYIGHMKSFSRKLVDRVGWFDSGLDGAQDYDFVLRASELAESVGHVPRVLYSWRAVSGSTAASTEAKPESLERGRLSVERAVSRRCLPGAPEVIQPDWALQAGVGMYSLAHTDSSLRVCIIIPTKDKVELLRVSISSILERTSYDNFEILLVDNNSTQPGTLEYFDELRAVEKVRIVHMASPQEGFSYAQLMNRATRHVLNDFDCVLYLNNDTEVLEPKWLSTMVGEILPDDVGAVGSKLLFENGTVQHAGIVHGPFNGLASPAFRSSASWDLGYMGLAAATREVSAVTAAAMLVKTSVFSEVQGFDEETFAVAYNDVDICYRLTEAGYRVIYCGSSVLKHHEGASRGFNDNPRELSAFINRYQDKVDCFYNPNLSLEADELYQTALIRPQTCPTPVRTICISHNLNLEGAPNSMFEMVSGLKKRGIIEPLVISPADGPLRKEYERAGILLKIVDHPARGHPNLDLYLARIREMAGDHREYNVVYANTLQSFWGIDLAQELGCSSVLNPRESDNPKHFFDFLPHDLRSQAYSSLARATRTVFVANATRRIWASYDVEHRAMVIPNGLNTLRLHEKVESVQRSPSLEEELGIGTNGLVVGIVGTVCDRKGQLDLIAAIKQLPSDVLESVSSVVIVGDRPGSYSDQLHKVVEACNPKLSKKVHVVGEVDDPHRYFRIFDIFVCTSYVESYPRVVLEAMAHGLPIISTNVNGIVEQVMENTNALLYSPGDVQALCSHLTLLIKDEELRARFAENANEVLRTRLDYEAMLDKYEVVFKELGSM